MYLYEQPMSFFIMFVLSTNTFGYNSFTATSCTMTLVPEASCPNENQSGKAWTGSGDSLVK